MLYITMLSTTHTESWFSLDLFKDYIYILAFFCCSDWQYHFTHQLSCHRCHIFFPKYSTLANGSAHIMKHKWRVTLHIFKFANFLHYLLLSFTTALLNFSKFTGFWYHLSYLPTNESSTCHPVNVNYSYNFYKKTSISLFTIMNLWKRNCTEQQSTNTGAILPHLTGITSSTISHIKIWWSGWIMKQLGCGKLRLNLRRPSNKILIQHCFS